MTSNRQDQEAGENAIAVQAGGSVVIVQGLTLAEARSAMVDVAKAVYADLAPQALELAKERAEMIAEKCIGAFLDQYPEGIQKANDPGFQRALRTVQAEFAATGDSELGDLLVQLLIDRTRQDERNLQQIVLNESLSTAAKLTHQQISLLTLIFIFRYTSNGSVVNNQTLASYLESHIKPCLPIGQIGRSSFQHLDFAGCGTVQLTEIALANVFAHTYGGLFTHGFEWDEIESRGVTSGRDPRLFIPCLNDSAKAQVSAANLSVLDSILDRFAIASEDRDRVRALFALGQFTPDEIKEKVLSLTPWMHEVFEAWDKTEMRQFTLTSVGTAIAHANIKRLVGQFAPLDIWVN